MADYTVKSGDSLWKIAQTLLGDPTRFAEIARLNNITDPNLIRPGQVLILPGQPSAPPPRPGSVPQQTPPPFPIPRQAPQGTGENLWARDQPQWSRQGVPAPSTPVESSALPPAAVAAPVTPVTSQPIPPASPSPPMMPLPQSLGQAPSVQSMAPQPQQPQQPRGRFVAGPQQAPGNGVGVVPVPVQWSPLPPALMPREATFGTGAPAAQPQMPQPGGMSAPGPVMLPRAGAGSASQFSTPNPFAGLSWEQLQGVNLNALTDQQVQQFSDAFARIVGQRGAAAQQQQGDGTLISPGQTIGADGAIVAPGADGGLISPGQVIGPDGAIMAPQQNEGMIVSPGQVIGPDGAIQAPNNVPPPEERRQRLLDIIQQQQQAAPTNGGLPSLEERRRRLLEIMGQPQASATQSPQDALIAALLQQGGAGAQYGQSQALIQALMQQGRAA